MAAQHDVELCAEYDDECFKVDPGEKSEDDAEQPIDLAGSFEFVRDVVGAGCLEDLPGNGRGDGSDAEIATADAIVGEQPERHYEQNDVECERKQQEQQPAGNAQVDGVGE